MLNYHRERFRKLTFRALALHQSLVSEGELAKKMSQSLSLAHRFTHIQGCHKDVKSKGNF